MLGKLPERQLRGLQCCLHGGSDGPLTKIPLRNHQFSIEHGAARGAAQGVVTQQNELVAQQLTGPQTPHAGCHSVPRQAIAPRLRAVRFRPNHDELRGRGGEMELLRQAAEIFPGHDDFGFGGRAFEFNRDALQVAIARGHAIAMGADPEIGRRNAVQRGGAQHLERLCLQLFFFIANVGNHIVNDVERRDAGIAGARGGLHGYDKDAMQTKGVVQRLERAGQVRGRAIGVGDDEARPAALFALSFDERAVLRVDLRNQERYVGHGSMRAGVGENGVAGRSQGRLQVMGDDIGQGRKKNLAVHPRLPRL